MSKTAYFDFDGTLAKGDSIVSFMRYAVRKRMAPPWQWFRAAYGYLFYRIHPRSASFSKEKAASFLKGRTEDEIRIFCAEYIREMVMPTLYQEGIQEIMRLKKEGWTVVLVSASMSCYMDLLPGFIPVDRVLATRTFFENGRCTGKFGPNCKGEEKVRRIHKMLAETGETPDETRGYGDSAADLPMLRMTGHPQLVNPRKKVLEANPDIPVLRWKEMDRT